MFRKVVLQLMPKKQVYQLKSNKVEKKRDLEKIIQKYLRIKSLHF